MKNTLVIGVLGGMGTYATIHMFEQYAFIFDAEKEWDRPRIIIDNNCTMPSRVRAILYNENVDVLVNEMTFSLDNLIKWGANRIILACNTSHLFLPYIYSKNPKLEKTIVNIIEITVKEILNSKLDNVYLLASEGTIESNVYQKLLSRYNLKCQYPEKDDYEKLRYCIESVKQNKYTDHTKNIFLELINRSNSIILGCTELPILFEKYKSEIKVNYVFDPIQLALKHIKNEFERNI